MKLKAGVKSRVIPVNGKTNLKVTSLSGCINVFVNKVKGSSKTDSCGTTGVIINVDVKGFNNFYFESKSDSSLTYRLTK